MRLAIAILSAALASPAVAQDADPKTVERLFVEIHDAPSLYARHQDPPGLKLPKIEAKALAGYGVDDPPLAKERERYQADKEKYAKEQPLRAALFEATIEMEKTLMKVSLRTSIRSPIAPKVKAAFRDEQGPLGEAIFKLDQALVVLKGAETQRGKEKSKRWQAHFDFTRARLEGNLIFLYEYSYALGAIRADNLPDLRPGEVGWAITYHPTPYVTEQAAKRLATDRRARLTQMQKDHANTPWAYAAEREGGRLLGMKWSPAKD